MDSELTIILKMIKQKTGLDIDAFSESMKFTATTRANADLKTPSVPKLDEVYSDAAVGKTFFSFRFRNANLIGSIDGVGESEKNYAYLLIALLEGNSSKEENVGRGEQLRRIVLGDCSRQQIQKYMNRFSVPEDRCFALVMKSEDGKNEKVMGFLSRYLSSEHDAIILTEDNCFTFVKFISLAEVNPTAYAQGIFRSVKEELGVLIEIGVSAVVKNLFDINIAYLQAVNALRMSKNYNSSHGVHAYKDYVFVKMLEDIPKFKLSEYLETLITPDAKAIFRDDDTLLTAESFLEKDLNVSETARSLYMHRNTLIYRLDKIEKETGLDIKRFSDALNFRMIAIMLKIIG